MSSGMNFREGDYKDRNVMQCLRQYCEGVKLDRKTVLSELNLDSLDLIEGLFELENYYGKTLSNTELASLTTVGDLEKAFCTPANQS
jgi:acyl carrier protein